MTTENQYLKTELVSVKENLKNEADEGFKRVTSVNKQLNANLGQKQREVVKLNAELAKLKKKVHNYLC